MNIKQLNNEAVRKAADQKTSVMECDWIYRLMDML
ncbi:MAG: hypothetical protein ACI9FJ_001621 [Alteromonadaceae bacterium]|jgi:hypothetical protein